jgi:hypothetical protein
MAGNANRSLPPAKFTSNFTRRLAQHSQLAYYYDPSSSCGALVAFMIDQLLVSGPAAKNTVVAKALENAGAYFAGETVFDENQPQQPDQQIEIWRLSDTSGSGTHADVAEAVWAVRPVLVAQGFEPEEVAPNHVLIPAPNYHDCPWGPPEEHLGIQVTPRMPGDFTVAVIDSGFLETGPIVGRAEGHYGSWLRKQEVTGEDGKSKVTYAWAEGSPIAAGDDPLDQNQDGALDALVGHANFVAGIVAQLCPESTIVVESHNGAFVEADDTDPAIPTEASVARSMWNHRNANLLHVGFAFPTLPSVAAPDPSDPAAPASWSLQVAVRSFPDRSGHFVVAPAGNQGCSVPQYPAALSTMYDNVVGVGSVDARGRQSEFSNYGPWVSCCTEGEDVVSTFIDGWNGPTEEAEPPGRPDAGTNPSKSFTGWASWSGTSFAAPKITAMLARGIVAKDTLPVAWKALQDGGVVDPELKTGVRIDVPMGVPV